MSRIRGSAMVLAVAAAVTVLSAAAADGAERIRVSRDGAWYRRAFDAPADLQGRHARLEFDAVFARARVWVNGQLVGSHEGGYTPFGFDITSHLLAGRPNTLALAVETASISREISQ